MLKRWIKVKGIEVNLSEKNLSYSIANTIGGKYFKALKRLNKVKNIIATFLKTGIIGLKD